MQEYNHCRKPERALNKCMFEKLVSVHFATTLERANVCRTSGSRQNYSWIARGQDTHTRGQEPDIHWCTEVDGSQYTCFLALSILPGGRLHDRDSWPYPVQAASWTTRAPFTERQPRSTAGAITMPANLVSRENL